MKSYVWSAGSDGLIKEGSRAGNASGHRSLDETPELQSCAGVEHDWGEARVSSTSCTSW